jgi:hypothetical protein
MNYLKQYPITRKNNDEAGGPAMLTNVYVWKPTVYFNKGSCVGSMNASFLRGFGVNLSWGHAALELVDAKNHEPMLYASYWPPETVPGKCVYSYQEDVDTMARPASTVITIKDLDSNAIEQAWSREFAKDFHNLQHNCCTVATQLLEAGFHGSMYRSVGSFLMKAGGSFWASLTAPITAMQANVAIVQGVMVFHPEAVEVIALHLRNING